MMAGCARGLEILGFVFVEVVAKVEDFAGLNGVVDGPGSLLVGFAGS